ncbi:MAG: hypothetical protein RLZ98_990 [Pseudomonadota bacterium]|jgi:iron(III) transport system substrate-binding protein
MNLHYLAKRIVAVSFSLGLAASVANAASVQEVLNYKGADRQKMLEEGAKKEGQLTIYSALTINQALRPLVEGFQKKYPYIKAEFWRGESRKIAQKVLAEQRANALVAGVLEGSGLAEIMSAAKAIEKFSTPYIANVPEIYRDPQNEWIPSRISYFGLAYNTKLIPPGSEPKSYEDLLDPKWQGKMAWRAGSESGNLGFITALRQHMGDAKAEEYFKKLAQQKIVNFTGSARTLVNRTIEGEYPIAINIFLHHPIISAQKGAPVASKPLEPIPSLNGTLQVPKGVKQPHAAMLFVDYYLSQEGQKILQQAQYFPVHKDVGPVKELEAVVPRLIGKKEILISPEVLFKERSKSDAIAKKYFR